MAITVLDWSTHQPDPPPRLAPRLVNGQLKHRYKAHPDGRMVMRDPADIDTILLHQTACVFGPAADPIKRHERAFDVPIHALSFLDGFACRPYPMLAYLYHGNAWNGRTYALEVEGCFCGLRDDPTTVARREDLETETSAHPSVLTPTAIEGARAAVQALYDEGTRLGSKLKYIGAHRQSSPTRRPDPGADIWGEVAIEFAMKTLGLTPLPSLTFPHDGGYGRPIPLEWDPVHGVGHY